MRIRIAPPLRKPALGNNITWKVKVMLLFILLLWKNDLSAQQNDKELKTLYSELDSLFSDETVSAQLLNIVDSLIALDTAHISTLNVRFGYVSNIVSAGRSVGFEKYGFTPSVSYYHHSGLFAGYTGYYSSEFEPGYYLNNISAGYLYQKLKSWTFLLNHDFYIYNDTLPTHAFNKSAQASVYFQKKFFNVNVDYSYLYGNETAHRLLLNGTGRLRIKTNGFVESITFMPGASFQWGNANVYYLRQPRTAFSDLYQIVKSNDYPALTFRNYLRLLYLLENNREFRAQLFLKEKNYTNEQIESLFNKYYNGQVTQSNTFGFMNYSFSVPIVLRSGPWSLTLNYTYNVPVSLPGETYKYDPNGFFSSSVAYTFVFVK